MLYAKNITWSELDTDNRVTATFDIYEDADLVRAGATAIASPSEIQQAIAESVTDNLASNSFPVVEEDEAVATELLRDISVNTELLIEV